MSCLSSVQSPLFERISLVAFSSKVGAMKKLLIIALFSGITLTACGVKGPLYFPENTSQEQQP
ncbi:LPS translocon maturation chaperone LptM [Ursidibacter arcticus]